MIDIFTLFFVNIASMGRNCLDLSIKERNSTYDEIEDGLFFCLFALCQRYGKKNQTKDKGV